MHHNGVPEGQCSCSPSDPFAGDIGSVVAFRAFVSSACERVETADWATLMVAWPNDRRVFEGDAHVREIEALQFADNDGPVFEALRTRRICRIASTVSSPGWPSLRELCRRRGIMSMASVPIVVEGVAVATLSLYSRDYHAFGPAETRTALRLTEQASQLIARSMSSAAMPLDQKYDPA